MPINYQLPRISQDVVKTMIPQRKPVATRNNALKDALDQARLKGQETSNAFAKKKLQDYESKKFQAEQKQKQAERSMHLSNSLKIATEVGPEAAAQYYKESTGEDLGFEFKGEKIKLKWDTPDGFRNELEAYPEQINAGAQGVLQGKSFNPNALAGNADPFAGAVFSRTKKKESEGAAPWSAPYVDPDTGTKVQKNLRTGRIASAGGATGERNPRVGDDAIVNQMRRMYGETDIHGLDENKANKALDAANLAKTYIQGGMGRIPAMQQAFKAVQQGAKVEEEVKDLPSASRPIMGMGGNSDEVKDKVAGLRAQGASDEMISTRLIDAGWNDAEIAGIMGAGKPEAAAPAGQKTSGEGKSLNAETAAALLKEAGGDKAKARELAKQRGYRF